LCYIAESVFCYDVEWTGHFISTAFDVLCCCLCSVDLHCFYIIAQRSEGYISDCVWILCYCGKHNRCIVCNGCICCCIINFFSVYFFFYTEEFYESSSCSGTVLTGNNVNASA